MQLKPSPSMAQQLSAILADIAAPATHHQARSGLVTILHALILSALDHLIRCLETAFALWQAGQLPALAPRATAPAPQRPARTTAAPGTTAPRPPVSRRGTTAPSTGCNPPANTRQPRTTAYIAIPAADHRPRVICAKKPPPGLHFRTSIL